MDLTVHDGQLNPMGIVQGGILAEGESLVVLRGAVAAGR